MSAAGRARRSAAPRSHCRRTTIFRTPPGWWGRRRGRRSGARPRAGPARGNQPATNRLPRHSSLEGKPYSDDDSEAGRRPSRRSRREPCAAERQSARTGSSPGARFRGSGTRRPTRTQRSGAGRARNGRRRQTAAEVRAPRARMNPLVPLRAASAGAMRPAAQRRTRQRPRCRIAGGGPMLTTRVARSRPAWPPDAIQPKAKDQPRLSRLDSPRSAPAQRISARRSRARAPETSEAEPSAIAMAEPAVSRGAKSGLTQQGERAAASAHVRACLARSAREGDVSDRPTTVAGQPSTRQKPISPGGSAKGRTSSPGSIREAPQDLERDKAVARVSRARTSAARSGVYAR